jgi:hypothetical protein
VGHEHLMLVLHAAWQVPVNRKEEGARASEEGGHGDCLIDRSCLFPTIAPASLLHHKQILQSNDFKLPRCFSAYDRIDRAYDAVQLNSHKRPFTVVDQRCTSLSLASLSSQAQDVPHRAANVS